MTRFERTVDLETGNATIDEQELTAANRYPDRAVHAGLHDHLTGAVLRVTARFMNGGDVSAAELGPLVTEWLRGHIATADRLFVN